LRGISARTYPGSISPSRCPATRWAALRDALHRYKVIFFKDQHLDHAAQIAFGRQFAT